MAAMLGEEALHRTLKALDRVYNVTQPDRWLDRMLDGMTTLTGMTDYLAMVYSPEPAAPHFPVGVPLSVAVRGETAGRLVALTSQMATDNRPENQPFYQALARCFRGRPALTQRDVLGPSFETSALGRALRSLEVQDQAILATTNGEVGSFIAIGLQRGSTDLADRSVPILEQLAPHASAAARLVQRALARQQIEPEARISPDGRVLHAEGSARSQAARERLRAAVRALERSRGPLSRRDPAAALELRVALVAGRWSLLDHWETDAQRYWVAVENEPLSPGHPEALTARQRSVVCLFARGLSDREIGRELGIAPTTVATHLKHACRRLGLPGRTALLAAITQPQTRLGPPAGAGDEDTE